MSDILQLGLSGKLLSRNRDRVRQLFEFLKLLRSIVASIFDAHQEVESLATDSALVSSELDMRRLEVLRQGLNLNRDGRIEQLLAIAFSDYGEFSEEIRAEIRKGWEFVRCGDIISAREIFENNIKIFPPEIKNSFITPDLAEIDLSWVDELDSGISLHSDKSMERFLSNRVVLVERV